MPSARAKRPACHGAPLPHPAPAVRAARLAAGLLVLLASALAAPAAGQAQSFGVTPARLAVPDAQPGQSYVRHLELQNGYDTPSTITVEREGEAAGWLSTDPPSGFQIPARSSRSVAVTIAVPAAAGPGLHEAMLLLSTEPKQDAGGVAIVDRRGVPVNVTLDGQARLAIEWSDARVADAAEGEPVLASALAANSGNVRATARLAGVLLPFGQDEPPLGNASADGDLLPGESSRLELSLPAGLPVGQYRVRLTADGFAATLPFKVVAPGAAAPDGELLRLAHAARSEAGRPVRIDARFLNSGDVAIAGANLSLEVRDGAGGLVAVLAAGPRAVPVGEEVDLTAYWTPERPGTYALVGQVAYDGYLSLPNESRLEVTGGEGAGFPWWWLLLVALAAGLALALWAWRRRRRRRGAAARGGP